MKETKVDWHYESLDEPQSSKLQVTVTVVVCQYQCIDLITVDDHKKKL